MKKKIIALLLALVLALGCFTACGSSDTDTAPTPTPEVTPEATLAPETDAPDKYTLAYESYDPKTVVMTVNGIDVHWEEYFYWICNVARKVEQQYGSVNWNDMLDDVYTFQDFALTYAESMLSQYWVVQDKAQELNVTLTEEDQTYIDQVYQSDIDTYGGGDEAAFEEYLKASYISPVLYRKMLELSQLYANLFIHHFGQAGDALADEDAFSYAEDAGYLHAKHILIMTLDADGKAMSDEDKAARKAIAQELYDELSAITDQAQLLKRFDELMFEYSDDTGLTFNPDGYYFLPGEMVTQFEEGTKLLEMYGMSEIIESPYGYHIILRLPLELDAAVDTSTGYTLRYIAASALYQNIVAEWFGTAEIVYADEFAALDFNVLFADPQA